MEFTKKIGVIDFGGQYAHLIASRLRRLGAYTEIISNEETLDKYREFSGLVFSGGPASVYEENSPQISADVLNLNIPVLGICYGHQLIMKLLGGEVYKSAKSEYGLAYLEKVQPSKLTEGFENSEQVWMSHGDEVVKIPEGFSVFARSSHCSFAGVFSEAKKIYCVQFHPEVTHSVKGNILLENFIRITGSSGTWNLAEFLKKKTEEILIAVPSGKKVFMLVSGGVDSTVAYTLLARILGKDRVAGLLVDTGFMRKKEIQILRKALKRNDVEIAVADASKAFYKALKGIREPEEKRKIIGDLFIKVKDEAVSSFISDPENWILGQGTIYPDTIESGGTKHSHNIKTHHNRSQAVLDLLEKGLVVEPLKELYKDEVRELGSLLGLSMDIIERHPFPGPGLAVRMIASSEDNEFSDREQTDRLISYYKDAQYRILPLKSVGVQGDSRSYRHCALLNDFTRSWHEYRKVSTDITNHIRGINRVVFAPFQRNLPDKLKFSQIYLDKSHSDLLRDADFIVSKILKKRGISQEIWQMPVVLIPVGKKKGRFSIVLRPVESMEAMTANFYPMRRKFLKEIVKSLKKLKKISWVFYDITDKPPGTIEWE